MLRRYRVNVNVGGLRAGERIEIDDEHPGWARYLRYLAPVDDDEPVDLYLAANRSGDVTIVVE